MKIEISERPANFTDSWPGQLVGFNFFDYACGIPSVLHAITTLKANGKPNVNFNGWASFSGSGGGFYAILPLGSYCHTYANILRTGEFAVNFLGKAYYEACLATIGTDDEADEFAAGGFTQEQAKTIAAPRIAEAFLSVECKLEKVVEYGEGGTLIVGKVINVSVAEEFADGVDGKYGDDGYMVYMSPKSLKTGAGKYAAATCKVFRVDEG